MTSDKYKLVSSRLEADWYPYHEDEWFTHTDIVRYFDWDDRDIKMAVSRKLYHDSTETSEPKLEKSNKAFRIINRDLEEIDWEKADPTDVYSLRFPYDMETGKRFSFAEKLKVPPKGFIIVAGVSDSGKTGFLLNMLVENMGDFDSHYFTSEMSDVSVKRRMIPLEKWYDFRNGDGERKFHIYNRSDNFHDVIKPNSLNYIDYLDVNAEGEYFKLKPQLRKIKHSLQRGIAVVALQKPPGRPDAFGGSNLRSDADLYIALDIGRLTIVKAKDNPGGPNLTGKKYTYNITNDGSMFSGIKEVFDYPSDDI